MPENEVAKPLVLRADRTGGLCAKVGYRRSAKSETGRVNCGQLADSSTQCTVALRVAEERWVEHPRLCAVFSGQEP